MAAATATVYSIQYTVYGYGYGYGYSIQCTVNGYGYGYSILLKPIIILLWQE
jgi:hypothetical protein